MRNLLLGVSLFFILISCKKESSSTSTTTLSIIGSWELRKSVNGQTGATMVSSPGNGSLLKFDISNKYETYNNKQLVKSGTYQIVKETSMLTNAPGDRLIYDNESNSVKTFISFKQDSLYIKVDANDGPSAVYLKISDK